MQTYGDTLVSKVIFVYGANRQGRHGKGSALEAKLRHGAKQGTVGFCGSSYGICTKATPYQTLSLKEIEEEVNCFVAFVIEHPELTFNIVRVGCGLAGYKDSEIAPLFLPLAEKENCVFDPIWIDIFKGKING